MASSTVTNAKYLDYAGLSTLVGNIKTLVDNKIIAAKQVLGGRLGKALASTEVQIGLHTPSGFTVNNSDVTELSSISIPGATTNNAGVMTADDKVKLNNISASAQVNQNAFSNVTITNNNGTSTPATIKANSQTDTLNLTAGTNIKITGDTNGDTITIDNTYEHLEYPVTTSATSTKLSSGSEFTVISTVTCGEHPNGHLNKIISHKFTLPTLLNNIKFAEKTASTPITNTVNVLAGFISATNFAGNSTATIQYNTIKVPTQKYVDDAILAGIATADALVYKGTKTASNNIIYLEPDAQRGWLYKVAATGTVRITGTTTNGTHVEPGDIIIANKDNASTLADWDIIERNLDGAVSYSTSTPSVIGNFAAFDSTTGKVIKDSGYNPSSFATAGHTHNITLSASGDDEIIVKKEDSGNLAVTFTISHATHLTSTFASTATTSTADAWGENVTVKVPKLEINTYGHITSASEVDYKISIPSHTHQNLDLSTYWGDGTDSTDVYNTSTKKDWKIYKGVKSISSGTNIGVSTTDGVVTITCSYTYSLPVATKDILGGIKIGYTTANKNYAIQLEANTNRAYVNVPWTDTKVQSSVAKAIDYYLLGSPTSTQDIDFAYKHSDVRITSEHILACAPSTDTTATSSKVITHSDAITTAMINALFA